MPLSSRGTTWSRPRIPLAERALGATPAASSSSASAPDRRRRGNRVGTLMWNFPGQSTLQCTLHYRVYTRDKERLQSLARPRPERRTERGLTADAASRTTCSRTARYSAYRLRPSVVRRQNVCGRLCSKLLETSTN